MNLYNNNKAVLIVNVGTPDNYDRKSVSKFIAEMLSDTLMVDMNPIVAKFLAKRIIAPLGSKFSSKKYDKIWLHDLKKDGSPLNYYMHKLSENIEKRFSIVTECGMRYGNPSFESAIKEIEQKCPELEELIIFPMFPHYAASSTETAFVELSRLLKEKPYSFKFIKSYYKDPNFISASVSHLRHHLRDFDYDRLIFDFHSLPISHVTKGHEQGIPFDYIFQVKKTVSLIADEMDIDPDKISIYYSSQRKGKWIEPFLNKSIQTLPSKGINNVAIYAPGFPIDNMETLYDLDIEARSLFLKNGGKQFKYIPSLNYNEEWVRAIGKITDLTP